MRIIGNGQDGTAFSLRRSLLNALVKWRRVIYQRGPMKRGVRYSLAVYVGLLFAGFLHQPNGRAISTNSASQTIADQIPPEGTGTQTLAKPLDCEAEAVRTLDRGTTSEHTPLSSFKPRHPLRNPFR